MHIIAQYYHFVVVAECKRSAASVHTRLDLNGSVSAPPTLQSVDAMQTLAAYGSSVLRGVQCGFLILKIGIGPEFSQLVHPYYVRQNRSRQHNTTSLFTIVFRVTTRPKNDYCRIHFSVDGQL